MNTGSQVKDTTHVEVADIAARNAYPFGKRKWGMRVTVIGGLTYYLLRGLSSTNKSDNLNWVSEALYMAAIGVGGGGSSAGAANEIQKGDGAGGFQGTKVYSVVDGNVQLGDAVTPGGHTIQVESSDVDANLNIRAKGAGAVVTINDFEVLTADYNNKGKIRSRADDSLSRKIERYFANDGTITNAGILVMGVFQGNDVPNSSVFKVTFETVGIKSTGDEIFSVMTSAVYQKNSAGVITRVGTDKTTDLTHNMAAGGIAVATSIIGGQISAELTLTAGSVGTYRLGHFVDKVEVFSYNP